VTEITITPNNINGPGALQRAGHAGLVGTFFGGPTAPHTITVSPWSAVVGGPDNHDISVSHSSQGTRIRTSVSGKQGLNFTCRAVAATILNCAQDVGGEQEIAAASFDYGVVSFIHTETGDEWLVSKVEGDRLYFRKVT
jgi:hypothetical protein